MPWLQEDVRPGAGWVRGRTLLSAGHGLRRGELRLIEVRVIPENPVSILSGDVTGCEWVDSACIRFNK